jgi:outer membrane protein assembly factor BamE (lipoprotein component of BamABCDE complex)
LGLSFFLSDVIQLNDYDYDYVFQTALKFYYEQRKNMLKEKEQKQSTTNDSGSGVPNGKDHLLPYEYKKMEASARTGPTSGTQPKNIESNAHSEMC